MLRQTFDSKQMRAAISADVGQREHVDRRVYVARYAPVWDSPARRA